MYIHSFMDGLMTTCYPPENPVVARGEQLAAEITHLAAHIHAATYRLLVMIAEFDEIGGWGDGFRSCAHWLNWACGIGMHAAREKVRVAKCLGDLPRVSAAFESGRISYSKARAITRVAHAENEELLVEVAENGTASHVERLVSWHRKLMDENERLALAAEAVDRRRFSWNEDDDGSILFRGRLPAEAGAQFIKAVQVAEREAFAEKRKSVPAGTPLMPESAEQRHADALTSLAEAYLAGQRDGAATKDKYQVILHVPAGTSKEACRLETGSTIPYEAAKRICCDAGMVPIEEYEDGNPLNVGRKTRKVPPSLRRALERRDGCCRFPGCTNTLFLDGHHINHWADGGETRLDNLVLLCSHHHGLVHEGGYGISVLEAGTVAFRRPDGKIIPEAVQLEAVKTCLEHLQAELDVDEWTCVANYGGDRMDYDLALDWLYEREKPE